MIFFGCLCNFLQWPKDDLPKDGKKFVDVYLESAVFPSNVFRKWIDEFEFVVVAAKAIVDWWWFKEWFTIAVMQRIWQNRWHHIYRRRCLWTEIITDIWLESVKLNEIKCYLFFPTQLIGVIHCQWIIDGTSRVILFDDYHQLSQVFEAHCCHKLRIKRIIQYQNVNNTQFTSVAVIIRWSRLLAALWYHRPEFVLAFLWLRALYASDGCVSNRINHGPCHILWFLWWSAIFAAAAVAAMDASLCFFFGMKEKICWFLLNNLLCKLLYQFRIMINVD